MSRLVSSSAKVLSSSVRNMGIQKVTHVIFDMDGLLLDTESLYTQATQKILNEYGNGQTYTWEVKASIMGNSSEEVAKRLVKEYDLPLTWQEYAVLQRENCEILMPEAELMPDTEPIYEDMVRKIAASYNKPYPFDVRMRIMGTTEQLTAKIAVTELNLPISVEQFLDKFSELSYKCLGYADLKQGAQRLVTHLYNHQIPICLATSSGQDMVKIKTQKHTKIFDLFHHKVCGSTDPEVKFGKPAPDIFLVAASRFPNPPKPEDCLVFEDAPNGVKAACSAGMQVVMVPDPKVPEEMREGATKVLNSLDEFDPEEFGLPAFSM